MTRKSLVGFALCFGSLGGCVTGPPLRTPEQPPTFPTIDTSVKEPSKRAPKPATCVAFGRFQIDAAKDGNRTPAQCRELYDTGRKYFQEAIKMDPKCADAYRGLVQAYEGLGDHARTAETYQKAQKMFPTDSSFHFEMGMYQARRKEWGPALDNLTKATELAPENRMYANMRGHCLARMGRYEESLAWFAKTVGEAEAHYNVARMLHHVEQGDACRHHLNRALELNPGFKLARDFLAQMDSPQSPIESAGHTAPPPGNGISSSFATDK